MYCCTFIYIIRHKLRLLMANSHLERRLNSTQLNSAQQMSWVEYRRRRRWELAIKLAVALHIDDTLGCCRFVVKPQLHRGFSLSTHSGHLFLSKCSRYQRLKIQNFRPVFGELRNTIKIVSTHNVLYQKFATVCQKCKTFCPVTFSTVTPLVDLRFDTNSYNLLWYCCRRLICCTACCTACYQTNLQ